MPGKIAVEVAYALPEKQYMQRVTLQEGATVEEAIRASGLLELRTDIDLTKNKVGIYSRPAKLSDSVHDGDRVEIYRPLIADPKRAAQATSRKNQQINNRQEKRCSLSTFFNVFESNFIINYHSAQVCYQCWSTHRYC